MALHDARLLEYDEMTGITELYYYDDDTGGFVVESIQDVTGILESNKACYNAAPDHWRGDMHRFASIPNVEMMKLLDQRVIGAGFRVEDQKRFRAWANDSANQAFRTRPGRV